MAFNTGRSTNQHQVAHVWAQQTKPKGRAGNLFFEGDTIYSYGRHFPIARFVERKGRRAVLFTTQTYSATTAAHIGAARGAVYGLKDAVGRPVPVFNVSKPDEAPFSPDIRRAYQARVDSLAETAARSRKYGESTIAQARELAAEANECAAFFGWAWRVELPDLSDELRAKFRARIEADRAASREREARRAEQRAKWEAEQRENRAKWAAGEAVSLARTDYSLPTLLRVKGDLVQTSRGAEVPVAHARRLWPLVQKVRASGEEYRRNGHTVHVGEFAVDAIKADGTLQAGCHTIAYAELAKIAAVLGLPA